MRKIYESGNASDQDVLDSIFGRMYEEQALSGGAAFIALSNSIEVARSRWHPGNHNTKLCPIFRHEMGQCF